jgi:superfamily II DNA or RNA helicase
MHLRSYQQAAIAAAINAWHTHKSTLVVMATGLGKTVTFAALAKAAVAKGRRVLVVAHTQELVRQAEAALNAMVGCAVGVEMAEQYSEEGLYPPPIVVGTVQTLSAKRGDRLRVHKFKRSDFGLVIFDEAHHSVAASWRAIADYFDGEARVRRLGVTATPDRGDGRALAKLYQSCAFRYDIRDGITDGWLVPIRQSMVWVEDLDLTQVGVVAGELNQGQLASVLEREAVLHGMVSATMDIAKQRRTLCFCASVDTAKHCAEILNRHRPGSAGWISGETPEAKRKETLSAFKAGQLQYLANCAVLTEGFDDPGIEVVAMMRPTRSRALYTQIVGRGTRALPGIIDGLDTATERRNAIAASAKPGMLVLDFCGNAGQHKLVSAADVLGGTDDGDTPRAKAVNAVRERAEAKAKDGGQPEERDILTIVDEEEREIIRRKEEASRSLLKVKASYVVETEDPFLFAGLGPRPLRSAAKFAYPATERQLEALRRFKVPNAHTLSANEAKRVLNAIRSRPSPAQARLLQSRGLDPAKFTRAEATKMISQLIGSADQVRPNGVPA